MSKPFLVTVLVLNISDSLGRENAILRIIAVLDKNAPNVIQSTTTPYVIQSSTPPSVILSSAKNLKYQKIATLRSQ